MRRIVRVIPAVVVLSTISLASTQQDEPRCAMPEKLLSLYRGNWELDRAASDFGIVPGPAMLTYAIDLADVKLHIKAAQTTDTGVAMPDEFSKPLNCSATALIVEVTLRWPPDLPEAKKSSDDKPDDGAKPPEAPKSPEAAKPAEAPKPAEPPPTLDVKLRIIATVSSDGKTLTERRFYRSAAGDTDQTLVFHRP